MTLMAKKGNIMEKEFATKEDLFILEGNLKDKITSSQKELKNEINSIKSELSLTKIELIELNYKTKESLKDKLNVAINSTREDLSEKINSVKEELNEKINSTKETLIDKIHSNTLWLMGTIIAVGGILATYLTIII